VTKGLKNLKLTGESSSGGGDYEKIRMTGQGKINGNVTFVIKGSTKLNGDVHSEKIEIHGSSTIGGKLSFKKGKVHGSASLKNGAKGEEFLLEGNVKIGGDCEVETAELKGTFTIDGLLNADQIAISLHGRSTVKEIGGETITVKRDGHVLLQLDKLIKSLSRELDADLIEGDVLKLEYTKAKIARGKNVEIGPGCMIELVEYSHHLHISEEAEVKETIRI
jgi:cytoskeletal protein CcmA (bactofilin family)